MKQPICKDVECATTLDFFDADPVTGLEFLRCPACASEYARLQSGKGMLVRISTEELADTEGGDSVSAWTITLDAPIVPAPREVTFTNRRGETVTATVWSVAPAEED